MRIKRHTKIVATLGPASTPLPMLKVLVEAGVGVFRINMSHTPREELQNLVSCIRGLEVELKQPIGILADLQGPKLRLGAFADEDGVQVPNGQRITLDSLDEPGTAARVKLPHPEILNALKIGDRLLVDDGKLRFNVVEKHGNDVVVEAVVGGMVKSRKGVSLPDTLLPMSALTEQDRSDLHSALEEEVDFVAISFVQRPKDVEEVRAIVQDRAKIISKIEKPQAIMCLEKIIDISDGIMVARGDLGVEMPLESVPGTQKRAIALAREAGKPVIVATQMLESMITAPVPTRAEVSDVASAVYDGADAVMLSAESAVGDFPVEAVSTMVNIIKSVEVDEFHIREPIGDGAKGAANSADAISAAARTVAEAMNVPVIVVYTKSGASALRVARQRPNSAILALSPDVRTARFLRLIWGLHAIPTEDAKDFDDMVDRACNWAKHEQFAEAGDRIVVVAGVPLRVPGKTNLLRIAKIPKAND